MPRTGGGRHCRLLRRAAYQRLPLLHAGREGRPLHAPHLRLGDGGNGPQLVHLREQQEEEQVTVGINISADATIVLLLSRRPPIRTKPMLASNVTHTVWVGRKGGRSDGSHSLLVGVRNGANGARFPATACEEYRPRVTFLSSSSSSLEIIRSY